MDNPVRSDPHRRRFSRHVVLGLVASLGLVLGALATRSCDRVGRQLLTGRSRACSDIIQLREALDQYSMQHGSSYPTSLEALVTPDLDGHRYLNQTKIPRDPWNREYVYVRDPVNVLTYGRDGVPGGSGEHADIDYASIVAGR